MSCFAVSLSSYLQLAPRRWETVRIGFRQEAARAFTWSLYCFQLQGSAACLMRRPCEVSHCVPKQRLCKSACHSAPCRWRSRSAQGKCSGCHGARCMTLNCSGGSPYCWYELVKVLWSGGAPSGSETGQDLVHFVQVLAVQSNRQSLEQGGLLGG